MTIKKNLKLARDQWNRYTAAMERGHSTYQRTARTNEDFYIGGGLQWDDEAKRVLESQGKPWLEENIIFSTINTVLGYQTQSRMDIAFKPREENDQNASDLLTKIGLFVLDQNKFPWAESQVFSDGLIQQRGYFDIRMEFDENFNGDIKITDLDPLDVIPDPDSKTYDPEGWADVMVTKWMTMDDVKTTYGMAKWRAATGMLQDEPDFGADDYGMERNKFGTTNSYSAYYKDHDGVEHIRVIERQWKKLQMREFWYDIETGEAYVIEDDVTQKEKRQVAKEAGYEIVKKLVDRVRWTVSTKDVILHDDWSPYEKFTIIPFFPYFRRGKTIGMVDNLVKTQEMLNKVFSQILHVVNTTANSGWIVAQDSLVNMDVEDLEDRGGETGLVIEVKPGRDSPQKIEPNTIPTGLKDLMSTGVELMRLISGVSESFQGGQGNEVSGVAIQNRVHQAAVQLATPIDNLFRTRNMVADHILTLIQTFFTDSRAFLIAEEDEEGEHDEPITINQEDDYGNIINDVTSGKYDVVVADVPTHITFQNAQMSEALEMRKYGVDIPDPEMVRLSTLARKKQIAEQMQNSPAQEQQQEQMEKQMELLQGQIDKLAAERDEVVASVVKKLAESGTIISQDPGAGAVMDDIVSTTDLPTMEDTTPALGDVPPPAAEIPAETGVETPLAGF